MFRDRLNAGSHYKEVWIRDFETFIEAAMEVRKPAEIRDAILVFFHFQGEGGDIVDCYVPKEKAVKEYPRRLSATKPEFVAHKNTVEVDQEPALVSAIWKYVKISGDASILQTSINDQTVLHRLERALDYLLQNRFDPKHELIWAATRIDWTDVQPEHPWGTAMDEASHPSLSIYDNAMFVLAVDRFLDLAGARHPTRDKWRRVRDSISAKAMQWLWDSAEQIPAACVSAKGIAVSRRLRRRPHLHSRRNGKGHRGRNVDARSSPWVLSRHGEQPRFAGAATIGLINYPPYPTGFFKNPSAQPNIYVNGTDWTWWGGCAVQMLVTQGMVDEAYRELLPIVDRAKREHDFREWYTQGNQPQGATNYLARRASPFVPSA